MKCALVTLFEYTLGHAAVARYLSDEIERSGDSSVVLTNKPEMFVQSGLLPTRRVQRFCWDNVAALRPDILLLDTIPFRRPDALELLLRWRAATARNAIMVVGHNGWLPAITPSLVTHWRHALSALGVKQVLAYHGQEVCEGQCHLAQLAGGLGVQIVHSGLLAGELDGRPRIPNTVIACLAGGYRAPLVRKLAIRIASSNPNTSVFISTPTPGRSPQEATTGLREVPLSLRQGARVASFEAGIGFGGYGTCVDFVFSRTPAMLLPLNPEQEATSAWARRFLVGNVTLTKAGRLRIAMRSAAPSLPSRFSWEFARSMASR